jgi:hypothetical protein
MMVAALYSLEQEPAVISSLAYRDVVHEYARLWRPRMNGQCRDRKCSSAGRGVDPDSLRIYSPREAPESEPRPSVSACLSLSGSV